MFQIKIKMEKWILKFQKIVKENMRIGIIFEMERISVEAMRRMVFFLSNRGSPFVFFQKIIFCLILIIGLNFNFGIFWSFSSTSAYFNDTENSDALLEAGSLDFSLSSDNFSSWIGLGEELGFNVVLTNDGLLPFQYTLKSEKVGGNSDFCNTLELVAELNGVEKYKGNLNSLDISSMTNIGDWLFEIKLPSTEDSFPHETTCQIDLVFRGFQTNVSSFDKSGFTDIEKIRINLISRMIVINEFLPNPEGFAYGFDFGDDSDSKPQGEWVELYNTSRMSFNLNGWYIKDNLASDVNKILITSSNSIPFTTVIDGKGWLVVYMNKAVFDNDGDTVKLFDQSNRLVDSYTYDGSDYCELEPTAGEENSKSGNGSCSGSVPPNKSYARIPDGLGSWFDPIPTPGRANIKEGGGSFDFEIGDLQNEDLQDSIPSSSSRSFDFNPESSFNSKDEEGEENLVENIASGSLDYLISNDSNDNDNNLASKSLTEDFGLENSDFNSEDVVSESFNFENTVSGSFGFKESDSEKDNLNEEEIDNEELNEDELNNNNNNNNNDNNDDELVNEKLEKTKLEEVVSGDSNFNEIASKGFDSEEANFEESASGSESFNQEMIEE